MPGQLGQWQQQRIEVSAADSSSAAEPAGGAAAAAAPERFYSLPGSAMPATAAAGGSAGGAAESAAAAGGLPQQQQRAAEPQGEEQQDSEFEQFEDVGDSSMYAASSLSASMAEGAAVDIDAVSVTGSTSGDKQLQQLPFSEEQLQQLIAGSLNRQYWEPIHDGVGSVRDVYSIRGPNYLKDRKKIPAGVHVNLLQKYMQFVVAAWLCLHDVVWWRLHAVTVVVMQISVRAAYTAGHSLQCSCLQGSCAMLCRQCGALHVQAFSIYACVRGLQGVAATS
jgi:hypothetical protein